MQNEVITVRQTDRQTDRLTDRHSEKHGLFGQFLIPRLAESRNELASNTESHATATGQIRLNKSDLAFGFFDKEVL